MSSIYRILHKNFKVGSKWNKYRDRKDISKAYAPRDVIQHDTVDFGELYAFTSIDVFTKEPMVVIVIDDNLTSLAGVNALNIPMSYYRHARINQSDEGNEFKGEFPDTVKQYNSIHVYSRPGSVVK